MRILFTNLFRISTIILFIISFFIFTSSSYAHNPPPDADGNCPTEHILIGGSCRDDTPTGPTSGTGTASPSSIEGGSGADVGTIALPTPDLLNVGGIAGNLLALAFFVAVLFFLIQLIIGGIAWTSAGGGDPKSLEAARGRITNAIIGLFIVLGAFALTLIITTILGINIFSGTITIN